MNVGRWFSQSKLWNRRTGHPSADLEFVDDTEMDNVNLDTTGVIVDTPGVPTAANARVRSVGNGTGDTVSG